MCYPEGSDVAVSTGHDPVISALTGQHLDHLDLDTMCAALQASFRALGHARRTHVFGLCSERDHLVPSEGVEPSTHDGRCF